MTFNRSPLESNLVNKVEKYIKTTYGRNAWFLKVAGSAAQRKGVPDILICLNGRLIGIETKREDGTGRPSENQKIECKKIMEAGGYAIISDNLEEIKNLLDKVEKLKQ